MSTPSLRPPVAISRAVDRAEAIIVEELVGAGLAFGGEHPDAPQAEGSAAATDRRD